MLHGLPLLLSIVFSWISPAPQPKLSPSPSKVIQDTSASLILAKLVHTLQSYQTLQLNFSLNLETYSSNKIKLQARKSGVFKMKGRKYYAGIREQEFFFDGKLLSVYDKGSNELQITQPDPHKSTGIGLNPQQIFTDADFYKKGFQYMLAGKVFLGGRSCWKIELVPVDKTVLFSKIWLYVSEADFRIRKVVISDKRGSKYTYNVRRMVVNKPLDDKVFVFDKNAHKNVEIVDLR